MHAESTGHYVLHKIRHNAQQQEKKRDSHKTLERQKRSKDQKNTSYKRSALHCAIDTISSHRYFPEQAVQMEKTKNSKHIMGYYKS